MAVEEVLSVNDVAAICHEANRMLCLTHHDESQVPWTEAPWWQRESAILGVEFNLANPDAPPSASHENWMKGKLADGWHYGPVKDPIRKVHPCLVPFDQLPAEQQVKDHLFKAIVNALAPFVKNPPVRTEPDQRAPEKEPVAFVLPASARAAALPWAQNMMMHKGGNFSVDEYLRTADKIAKWLETGQLPAANVETHPARVRC